MVRGVVDGRRASPSRSPAPSGTIRAGAATTIDFETPKLGPGLDAQPRRTEAERNRAAENATLGRDVLGEALAHLGDERWPRCPASRYEATAGSTSAACRPR